MSIARFARSSPPAKIPSHTPISLSRLSRIGWSKVEHVHAVIEVKSRLTNQTARDSVNKLLELIPFLEGTDSPHERYPKYFPRNLYLGCVFFEMVQPQLRNRRLLNCFIPAFEKRGFHGVTVLRADTIPSDNTLYSFPVEATNMEDSNNSKKKNKPVWSDEFQHYNGQILRYMIAGLHVGFQMFAFDLIARMNGTYQPNRYSSFHGMSLRDAE